MILDLFAGPGGWDQGLSTIGVTDVVGIDRDYSACRTAMAAGHARICADVTRYPTSPFAGQVDALVASPPCQAWSLAGCRAGERDRVAVHAQASRFAVGDDDTSWNDWHDPRSPLAVEPVRWIRDLRPLVVALEEVPAVEGLWRHLARILQKWGYRTWVATLCAADYGVPQTRHRVILGARLREPVAPPLPTHTGTGETGVDLFGDRRSRWVTLAAALARKAEAGTSAWWQHRPATTVVGSFAPEVIAAPGYRTRTSRQDAVGSVTVSVAEAGLLQSFPSDYPWHGSRAKQFEQVGNAIPPLLAAHIGASLGLGQPVAATAVAA